MPSPRANRIAPAAAGAMRFARGSPANAQIVTGTFRLVEIDPAGLEPLASCDYTSIPVAAVGPPVDRECLQPPARRQLAATRRQEAVEQPVGHVLGLVDDAGRRIDDRGLAAKAAHGDERHGIDRAGGVGRNFEGISVIAHHAPAGARHVLLASQPAAPGSDAAGAVADRARKRAELAFEPQRGGIEHHRRGAAGQDVARSSAVIGEPRGPAAVRAGRQLVVADQRELAAGQRDTAHAVRRVGHTPAVVHRIAARRQHAVRKSLWQIEQPRRIGLQCAVTGARCLR